MATYLRVGVLVLVLGGLVSSACARGELTLKIPEGTPPQSLLNKKVYIQSVTDKRLFQDHPRDANVPSLAAGLEKTTDEQRSHAVVRVRDGNGKARNNLFSIKTQPVEAIVHGIVRAALIQRGYTVVATEAEADAGTTRLTVDINQFWGYIKVVAGGWAGVIPTMEGEIKTTLILPGDGDASHSFTVSAKATHKFGLMTGKHWVLMFSELTDAYLTKFPSGKI